MLAGYLHLFIVVSWQEVGFLLRASTAVPGRREGLALPPAGVHGGGSRGVPGAWKSPSQGICLPPVGEKSSSSNPLCSSLLRFPLKIFLKKVA